MAAGARPTRRPSQGTVAAPAADTSQAAEAAGPVIAAARSASPRISDRRSGVKVSKVAIPKPQNSSTDTMARRTRLSRSSRSPPLIAAGVSRAARVAACHPFSDRISVIRRTTPSRLMSCSARETTTGVARASRP